MNMRRIGWMGLSCWLAAAAAWGQAPDLSKLDVVLRSVPDGPVALVNGRGVDAQDYRELYTREIELMQKRGMALDDRSRVQAGLRVLGRLIETEILLQEAERRKLSVPDAELQEAWQKEMKYMQEQLGEKGGTEADLLKKAGTTREQALNELKRVLLVDKMAQTLVDEKGVKVSDQEVAQFIKQNEARFDNTTRYHIRHLVLKPQSTRGKVTAEDKAKARQKAETALSAIRAGRSFESVAKEVSQGPRKEQGGDLGFLAPGEMPPFIAAVVPTMQPNQLSDIIESDVGYHLVQLVEVQAGGKVDTEKVKPRIKDALLSERGEKVVKEFVANATQKEGVLRIYLQLPEELAPVPPQADAKTR